MSSILSPSDIEEFRAIWLAEKGEELPLEKAQLLAPRFLSVIQHIVTLCDRADARAAGALDDSMEQMS